MLLIAVWRRLLIAGVLMAALWAAVLWVAPSTPSTAPARPPALVAALTADRAASESGPLRAVVRSGQAAPGGGSFDRFDVVSQPIVAPVNARGQVAFYATVLHAAAREGIFLADAGSITKVAAFGDAVPGGGTLVGIRGASAAGAECCGACRVRRADRRRTRPRRGCSSPVTTACEVIALAGDDAPGVPAGVLVGFDAPALNDNDEMAFVATVRRGREMLDVLYFWNGRRLQRLVAEGERLLRDRRHDGQDR